MKKILFAITLAAAATTINAQLVVDSLGHVGVGTETPWSLPLLSVGNHNSVDLETGIQCSVRGKRYRHNYVPRIIYVNVADTYIQNKVFNNSDVDYYYLKDASISAGHDVTASIPFGNVIIERGSKLSINKKNGVRIKNGFKCKIGGELQIK